MIVSSLGLNDKSGKNPKEKYYNAIKEAETKINISMKDVIKIKPDSYGANYHNDDSKKVHFNFTDTYFDKQYPIENFMICPDDTDKGLCYLNGRILREIKLQDDNAINNILSGVPLSVKIRAEYDHRFSICDFRINASDKNITEKFLNDLGVSDERVIDHLLDHRDDLKNYVYQTAFTDFMKNDLGMSDEDVAEIRDKLLSKIGRCRTLLLLRKVIDDVDTNIAELTESLYKKYSHDTLYQLANHPFEIACDQLSIKARINIAKLSENIKADDPRLLTAYSEYIITEHLKSTGSTAITIDDYIAEYAQMSDNISEAFTAVNHARYIKSAGGMISNLNGRHYVSSKEIFNMEKELGEMIWTFAKAPKTNPVIPDHILEYINSSLGFALDDEQVSALKSVFNCISIITGGPGTGKTSVIKALNILIDYLFPGSSKLFCAPTAKAANKMQPSAAAKTITLQKYICSYVPKKLIPDFLMIDEFSMCDIKLVHDVFLAAENARNSGRTPHIIILGDPDQLGSIEQGNVLNDLIDSGVVPVVRLTDQHRCGSVSSISTNAAKVLKGESDLVIDDNFNVCKAVDEEDAFKTILNYSHYMQDNYSSESIQIISPIKASKLGVNKINDYVCKIFNPSNKRNYWCGRKYAVGDKVVFNTNKYCSGYINGDVGIITDITSDAISIDVNGNIVTVPKEDHNDFSLAFCETVHKMQGSEADNVIIALPKSRLTDRNMLYTAITRARKRVDIIYYGDALEKACENKSERTTLLKEFIDMLK